MANATVRCLWAAVAFSVAIALNTEALADPLAYSPDLMKVARRALDDHLPNYPSSRFRSVSLVHGFLGPLGSGPDEQYNPEFTALCGEINTQNKMGGYTGWIPFDVQWIEPWPAAAIAASIKSLEKLSEAFNATMKADFEQSTAHRQTDVAIADDEKKAVHIAGVCVTLSKILIDRDLSNELIPQK